MKTDSSPMPREARELQGRQRRSGRSWGGNRPRQWAVLAAVALLIALIVAAIALLG